MDKTASKDIAIKDLPMTPALHLVEPGLSGAEKGERRNTKVLSARGG